MRINDLYCHIEDTKKIQILKTSCSQFLRESRGLPLLKNLPSSYKDFHKVKVRKRKGESGEFADTFNEAFETQHPGIRNRAIFANGIASFNPSESLEHEPFYIFLIDGYKFIYSREVMNSGEEYKQVFHTLFEQFGEERGNEVLTDLLRFTYTSTNLYEGIDSGSEIIVYGIPYFYAIRTSTIKDYSELLCQVKD